MIRDLDGLAAPGLPGSSSGPYTVEDRQLDGTHGTALWPCGD